MIWYVAYGSNMSAARLSCYLAGGCPAGSLKTFTGARDPNPPRRTLPITLPGTVYFAGDSLTWGGGRAYYDPSIPGETPAVAYLITTEQFDDIRAQEPPVYDRLLEVGAHDEVGMRTFTSRHSKHEVPQTKPMPAYLRTMADGLAQAHGWDAARIERYFATLI